MANLATMIMEGTTFSTNGSSIDTSKYDFSKTITMESECLNGAIATLYSDIMEADMSYMAADVVTAAKGVHAKVVNESFEMEPVIEGMIKGFFNKIVEALKKFWAKIKEWFKKIYEWFRMMFSNAKEFAKRYGKELRNKKYDGFKWEGHEWTLDAGNSECDKWVSDFRQLIETGSDKVEKVKDVVQQAESNNADDKFDEKHTRREIEGAPKLNENSKAGATVDDGYGKDFLRDAWAQKKIGESTQPLFEAYDVEFVRKNLLPDGHKYEDGKSSSDYVDDMIQAITKAADLSEMRSNLEEKYRAGSTEKGTITDFDCGKFKNPGAVIDFLDKGDKIISDFEKSRKDIERPIEKLIKAIDKIKVDERDTTKNGIITSNISWISAVYTGILNAIKACIDVKISAHRDALKELLGAMKRFYSFKSATESMDMFDVESFGVLESISVVTESDDEGSDDDSKKGDGDDEGKKSKKKDDDGDSEGEEEEASESVKAILEMAHSYVF